LWHQLEGGSIWSACFFPALKAVFTRSKNKFLWFCPDVIHRHSECIGGGAAQTGCRVRTGVGNAVWQRQGAPKSLQSQQQLYLRIWLFLFVASLFGDVRYMAGQCDV